MVEYTAGFSHKRPGKDEKLSQRFQTLHQKKGDMLRRCEDYSMWTLPYVFPIESTRHTELQGPVDSTGARAVNHLSNKLIMTLFQPHNPFFRLMVQDDVTNELKQLAEDGDEEATQVMADLDTQLAEAERGAMRELDYNTYRTEATMVAKSLIITGNALIYHPDKGRGRVQSYSLRDFCVVRDLSGNVIEIITRDKKALYTFSKDVIDTLKGSNKRKYDKDNCDITLYTHLLLKEDGKFHLRQCADDVELDSKGSWTAEDLPWIALTWNRVRGEDYGRGLVEDYAGSFHALYTLNNALIDLIGVAADIKFFVDPASVVDVKELNNSASGTYHAGKEGDVTISSLNGKQVDIALIEAAIDRYEKQIAQAFLINSAMTRDAERVTAEEIRMVANDLEMQHGGIYSRFAEEWQYRTATLMLKRVNVKIGKDGTLYPQIITGLDSLSRAGDLDNLRLFVADMALLEGIPEEIRAVIDGLRFAQFIGIRRGVDYEKFLKTPGQLQAEAQAQAAQQQAAIDQQANAQLTVEAGKAAVNKQ